MWVARCVDFEIEHKARGGDVDHRQCKTIGALVRIIYKYKILPGDLLSRESDEGVWCGCPDNRAEYCAHYRIHELQCSFISYPQRRRDSHETAKKYKIPSLNKVMHNALMVSPALILLIARCIVMLNRIVSNTMLNAA